MQVEVVPAEDAGELATDVPHAEDGDARPHGQRLEEDADLAAAALAAVLGARLVAEGDGELLGRGRAVRRAADAPA